MASLPICCYFLQLPYQHQQHNVVWHWRYHHFLPDNISSSVINICWCPYQHSSHGSIVSLCCWHGGHEFNFVSVQNCNKLTYLNSQVHSNILIKWRQEEGNGHAYHILSWPGVCKDIPAGVTNFSWAWGLHWLRWLEGLTLNIWTQ